jgi:hypothetical protein
MASAPTATEQAALDAAYATAVAATATLTATDTTPTRWAPLEDYLATAYDSSGGNRSAQATDRLRISTNFVAFLGGDAKREYYNRTDATELAAEKTRNITTSQAWTAGFRASRASIFLIASESNWAGAHPGTWHMCFGYRPASDPNWLFVSSNLEHETPDGRIRRRDARGFTVAFGHQSYALVGVPNRHPHAIKDGNVRLAVSQTGTAQLDCVRFACRAWLAIVHHILSSADDDLPLTCDAALEVLQAADLCGDGSRLQTVTVVP